ncbi:MAG: N-acetylmuramoyl-L-alanine amidase [Deltaproteobacteria bacterium]|nr:MAG: N-acetylmuramoyl-L-alanine amidase [Deltaproteobacteria bacterium]
MVCFRKRILLLIGVSLLSLFFPRGSLSQVKEVRGIRFWASPDYVRVVADLEGEVSYKANFLRKDPKTGKSARLFVDLSPARLSSRVPSSLSVKKGLIYRIRVGQHDADTVRVVLDLKEEVSLDLFSLTHPFRVVVDLYRSGKVRTARRRPFRVIIDPGHGGHDPGAIGPTGLKEKTVVLKIAKRLAAKIRRELGWEAILTRKDDRYLSLEERTAIANVKKGDLFLSIHTNASRSRLARGIETYFLNFTTDKYALRLAARENNLPPERISALQLILYDLMLSAKVDESSRFARYLHRGLIRTLRRRYRVRDLGVKQAPFLVLIGAKMPSVLVEVSFISNPWEEKMLRDDRYLSSIAQGLLQGLRSYVKRRRMLADFYPPSHFSARSSN